ncbi:MAG: hypothetical protein ACC618_02700 [Patescibacteria group bacterium]
MVKRQLPHDDLVKTSLPKKGEQPVNNQVSVDLGKVKEVKDKVFGKVTKTVAPVVAKQGGKVKGLNLPFKDIMEGDLVKKLVRIVLIFFLLIALLYIGSIVFRTINQGNDTDGVVLPSPTPAPFQPFQPSIYAEDEQVLQMEEDIKVLDRELSTAKLRETILTPPVLDFDINFGE